MTIIEALEQRALDSSSAPFIRAEHKTWCFHDFFDEVQRLAAYLKDTYDIQPKDRIVLCFPNEVNYLIAYFACWFLGAVPLPVDFDMREHTLVKIAADANPKMALFSDQRKDVQHLSKVLSMEGRLITYPQYDLYANHPLIPRAHIEKEHCALIMYTSGTTGQQKGVMLSHGCLAFTAQRIIEWANLASSNCEVTAMRLTHSFGLGHVHCAVLLGSSLLLLDSLRDAKKFLNCVALEEVTGIPATPAMIRLMLTYHREHFQQACFHLSYIIINTSPISRELVADLLQALPYTRVYMYYGLTEASRSTYISYREHPDKLESVGQCPDGVEIRIDSQTKEIQVIGNNLMSGYLNDANSFLRDGWFATGDIGRLDSDGFLYITGRIKEQINIDGMKVNPLEVEQVISRHPKVKECIVFSITDPLSYEKAAAVIVIKEAVDEPRSLFADIKKHCKKYLEMYKIPREFDIWNEIPKTDSGKPKRLEARQIWEGGKKPC